MADIDLEQLKSLGKLQELRLRAMEHPTVLRIMADCADVIDTENSAIDPALSSVVWQMLAADLRERADKIEAEDPELWETPEYVPVARVAEVHMSRYTIEWLQLPPLPEGTVLYGRKK